MKKDISEMDCKFTENQVYNKVKEVYPQMEHLEINYHVQHILDVDWLKVTNDENELETVIREQVEGE